MERARTDSQFLQNETPFIIDNHFAGLLVTNLPDKDVFTDSVNRGAAREYAFVKLASLDNSQHGFIAVVGNEIIAITYPRTVSDDTNNEVYGVKLDAFGRGQLLDPEEITAQLHAFREGQGPDSKKQSLDITLENLARSTSSTEFDDAFDVDREDLHGVLSKTREIFSHPDAGHLADEVTQSMQRIDRVIDQDPVLQSQTIYPAGPKSMELVSVINRISEVHISLQASPATETAQNENEESDDHSVDIHVTLNRASWNNKAQLAVTARKADTGEMMRARITDTDIAWQIGADYEDLQTVTIDGEHTPAQRELLQQVRQALEKLHQNNVAAGILDPLKRAGDTFGPMSTIITDSHIRPHAAGSLLMVKNLAKRIETSSTMHVDSMQDGKVLAQLFSPETQTWEHFQLRLGRDYIYLPEEDRKEKFDYMALQEGNVEVRLYGVNHIRLKIPSFDGLIELPDKYRQPFGDFVGRLLASEESHTNALSQVAPEALNFINTALGEAVHQVKTERLTDDKIIKVDQMPTKEKDGPASTAALPSPTAKRTPLLGVASDEYGNVLLGDKGNKIDANYTRDRIPTVPIADDFRVEEITDKTTANGKDVVTAAFALPDEDRLTAIGVSGSRRQRSSLIPPLDKLFPTLKTGAQELGSIIKGLVYRNYSGKSNTSTLH